MYAASSPLTLFVPEHTPWRDWTVLPVTSQTTAARTAVSLAALIAGLEILGDWVCSHMQHCSWTHLETLHALKPDGLMWEPNILIKKEKKTLWRVFQARERELIWSSFKHLNVGLDGVQILNTYCLKSARPHTPFVNWQFLSVHLKHYPSIQYLYHLFLSESREAIPSDTDTPWINCQPITRLTWRGEQSLTHR